jgi:hypothetical protein
MRPKSIKYIALAIAFAVFLLFSTFQVVSAGSELDPAENQGATAPPLSSAKSGLAAPLPQAGGATTATLQAASGAEIDFYPGNDDTNPVRSLPHLTLYENGGLSPAISRTLLVTVSDIEVPLAGVTVTPKSETCTLANLPLADL